MGGVVNAVQSVAEVVTAPARAVVGTVVDVASGKNVAESVGKGALVVGHNAATPFAASAGSAAANAVAPELVGKISAQGGLIGDVGRSFQGMGDIGRGRTSFATALPQVVSRAKIGAIAGGGYVGGAAGYGAASAFAAGDLKGAVASGIGASGFTLPPGLSDVASGVGEVFSNSAPWMPDAGSQDAAASGEVGGAVSAAKPAAKAGAGVVLILAAGAAIIFMNRSK